MKLFIYKTLIVVFLVYVLFEITIGQRINKFEEKISYISSPEGRDIFISKIKEEMKNANKKENYLDPEERELIRNFIKKIQKELSLDSTN
tara:strand:- start:187 stop:456 length:270 start_codon:yes stop_codon:yes gene_type:complete